MYTTSSRRSSSATQGRFEEVVIRLLPSRSTQSESRRSSSGEATRSYDALVYSNMELQGLGTAPPIYAEQYAELDTLGLVGVEQVSVRWSRYHEYLDAFVEGEKAIHYMRSHMIKTLSSGLEGLFKYPFPTPKPVRIWWSSETPELEDLPWELIAYTDRQTHNPRLSFVRGLPGDWAPLVPLEQPQLRLALIHAPARTPALLEATLMNLRGVKVESMTGPPREALHRAAREKFELVHIVADGSFSLAYEGILEMGGSKAERIAPGELSSLLFGSRVTIIGLTPAEPLPSTADESPAVPTAYRSFVCLGSSRQVLPTIVSPLGPMHEQQLHDFWRLFYEQLAETLSVEDAMAHAQSSGPSMAAALFLRHRLGREFARQKRAQSVESPMPAADPVVVNADLQVSRSFLDELRAVDAKYSELSGNVTDSPLAEAENARQDQLDGFLESWRGLTEEEKL